MGDCIKCSTGLMSPDSVNDMMSAGEGWITVYRCINCSFQVDRVSTLNRLYPSEPIQADPHNKYR